MRVILRLQSNKNIKQKELFLKYHHTMHGFVYSKITDSEAFKTLHKKQEFKPFSFGNLFPVKEETIKEGENYSIVISSPIPKFIEELFFSITPGEVMNIGEASFMILEQQIKQIRLKNNSIIENISPINLTKHENNTIKSLKFGESNYVEQLRENLIKKYNQYNKEKIENDFRLFENIEIKPNEKRKEASFPIYFFNKGKNEYFNV
ncbi:CRISPR-associated endoribonuclease Cas6, partial [Candidatus Woesearchaeota archaeon]